MINYINYLITIVGLGMIIISLLLIAADKIRGESIYYDLYMKEQEIKKAIEDADEMIGELVYTSEAVISEIEEYINNKRQLNKSTEGEEAIYNESKEEKILAGKSFPAVIKTNKEIDVLDLFNEGMNIDDIARRLNIGKGEVSLILSLNSGVKNNEII